MDRNTKPAKILGIITALVAVAILLFLISITAGEPVECGEPPEWTGGEVTSRQAEWTAEGKPDVTVILNSTLAWGSTWNVDRWSHSCRMVGNASAHSEEGDCRAITGQHAEVGIDTPNTHLLVNPYPKHPDYFGGHSDPDYGMVIREMLDDTCQRVHWEWTFTNPFAATTRASHYARWDFLIPPDSFCNATVIDAIETNKGEEISLTWKIAIDALPDPEGLSEEEMALYGIKTFTNGGGYAAPGAIHITPEGGGI